MTKTSGSGSSPAKPKVFLADKAKAASAVVATAAAAAASHAPTAGSSSSKSSKTPHLVGPKSATIKKLAKHDPTPTSPSPSSEDSMDEGLYELSEIIGKYCERDGSVFYRVRWAGFPDPTDEPAANLAPAHSMVDAWEKDLARQIAAANQADKLRREALQKAKSKQGKKRSAVDLADDEEITGKRTRRRADAFSPLHPADEQALRQQIRLDKMLGPSAPALVGGAGVIASGATIDDNDDEEMEEGTWIMRKIIGKRKGTTEPEYLIEWEDVTHPNGRVESFEPTYEPRSNILDDKLVFEFEERAKRGRKTRPAPTVAQPSDQQQASQTQAAASTPAAPSMLSPVILPPPPMAAAETESLARASVQTQPPASSTISDDEVREITRAPSPATMPVQSRATVPAATAPIAMIDASTSVFIATPDGRIETTLTSMHADAHGVQVQSESISTSVIAPVSTSPLPEPTEEAKLVVASMDVAEISPTPPSAVNDVAPLPTPTLEEEQPAAVDTSTAMTDVAVPPSHLEVRAKEHAASSEVAMKESPVAIAKASPSPAPVSSPHIPAFNVESEHKSAQRPSASPPPRSTKRGQQAVVEPELEELSDEVAITPPRSPHKSSLVESISSMFTGVFGGGSS